MNRTELTPEQIDAAAREYAARMLALWHTDEATLRALTAQRARFARVGLTRYLPVIDRAAELIRATA